MPAGVAISTTLAAIVAVPFPKDEVSMERRSTPVHRLQAIELPYRRLVDGRCSIGLIQHRAATAPRRDACHPAPCRDHGVQGLLPPTSANDGDRSPGSSPTVTEGSTPAGVARNQLGLSLRVAAIKLGRLVTLGLDH
jgi:hypothetical protein